MEKSTNKALFVLDQGPDPQERLENAILWSLVHARLGDAVEASPDTEPVGRRHLFGRYDSMRVAMHSGTLAHPPHPGREREDYWTWPTFLAHAERDLRVAGYAGAAAAVEALHARGRDAFVKATVQKRLALHVPVGTGFDEAMGDLAYSFCDSDIGMIVQERVEMTHEYRILVVDGVAVTGAGCIPSATPLDHRANPSAIARRAAFDVRTTERIGDPPRDATTYEEGCDASDRVARYVAFADAVVPGLIADGAPRSFGLDLCTVEGRIAIVEVNPFHLGRIGLFACDASALVDAVLKGLGLLP